MPTIQTRVPLRELGAMCLLGVGYFALAKIGFEVSTIDRYAPLLWPASGLALAALVIGGYELWPGIMLASFIFTLSLGATPLLALGVALGNTAEALIGTYLLKSVYFNPMFSRIQDSLALIIVSFITSIFSASIGLLTLALLDALPAGHVGELWVTWWISHSLGTLIFAPFFTRWLYRPIFTKTRSEIFEGILIFGSLIGINILIFWYQIPTFAGIPSVYVLLVPIIWAALRSGPRGTTLALVITTVMVVTSAVLGHAPANSQQIFLDQVFLGVITVIFLLFASIFEERKEAVIALRDHIDKLEDAIQKVQQADEAKSEFIAILAHELRNPLSPIVSSLELMEKSGLPPENQASFETIRSHVEVIVRLLDDLLDVTRVTRKKFKLRKETIELQQIFEHVRQTVTSFYTERQHTLVIDSPKEPIFISGDPVRIEQIFVNILFNAAKYTRPGGTVTVTLRKSGAVARVSIKDTGIGIPSDMLERIFEPFFQARSDEQASSGLGLGLALTKRLVELHEGTIRVKSPGEGKGSEFIVELPLPQRVGLPFPIKTRIPRRMARADAQKYKILVVDDNEAAAKGLGALLTHSGHEVELAFGGMAALEKARKAPPRVVLLDIGMPGLDGYAVARRMREEHRSDMVLIALTGYGQDEDKQKARAAGFNHHLTKPVGVLQVEEILARLTEAAPITVPTL